MKKNRFLPMVSLLFLSILMCFLFASPGMAPVDIDVGQTIEQAMPATSDVVRVECLSYNAINYNYLYSTNKRTVDRPGLLIESALALAYSSKAGTVLKYPI